MLLPWGMVMENSACSFVCLCPWKNPSAIKTLELSTIVLFCVKRKIGVSIYCAHHSPGFNPQKDLISIARETVCQQPYGLCDLQTHYEADYFVKKLRTSRILANVWKQYATVNEVPKLFEIIISNRFSLLWSPLCLLLRLCDLSCTLSFILQWYVSLSRAYIYFHN